MGSGRSAEDGLRRLAERSANFGHLLPLEPLLVSHGAAAESTVYEDPNTSLVKVDRLRALNQAGALTPTVHAVFDELRRTGNRAVHEHYADGRAALTMLRH